MSFATKLKHKNNEAHLGKNLLYTKCEIFAQARANELEGFSVFTISSEMKFREGLPKKSSRSNQPLPSDLLKNWHVMYLRWYFFIRKSSSWRIGLFFWVRLFFGNVYLTNESKITNISGNSLIVTTHF